MLNATVFHAANLLVHITSAIIVYLLLRRLIGPRWPAAAGAILFAIHPLQVEPVAWATGMKDLLSGMLALAAIWQYVCFIQTSKTGAQEAARIRHYVWAMTAFVLALLSKPSTIVVPIMLLVIELGVIRRSLRKADVWAALKPLLPMLALSLVWVSVSTRVQTVVKPADEGHILLRPLIAADALTFYLYKLFFPLTLGIHYDHGPMTMIRSGMIYFTWIVPVALLAASIAFYRKARWLLPAALLFVIGVAPVLGLTPFAFQRFSTVADRYIYISMLGPALAVAAIFAGWKGMPSTQTGVAIARPSRNVIAFTVVAFLILGARSFAQTFTWLDTRRLFTHALEVNPRSYDALEGLAAASSEQPDEAIGFARRAIAVDPDRPEAYLTLGANYLRRGDQAEGDRFLQKAVALNPDGVMALWMLGSLRIDQKNYASAEELLQRAIKLDHDSQKAHLNLAKLLAATQRPQEALQHAELAVELDRTDALARYYYASILRRTNHVDAAIHQLQMAQRLDPKLPEAQGAYQWLAHLNDSSPAAQP
jgi:tetratricopeptide (TPR) repeat protein